MNIFKGIVNKAAQSLLDSGSGTKKPTKSQLLCDEFKLPDGQTIIDEITADISVTTKFRRERLANDNNGHHNSYMGADDPFTGKLTLTQNFLLFKYNYDSMVFSFVIELISIQKIERVQSYDFTILIQTSNDLEITVQFVGIRSNSENFGKHLTIALKKQLVERSKLNTFLMSLYSEYLMYKNQSSDLKIEGPPASGLGWVFKFPGNPQKLNDRLKMKKWFDLFRENGRNLAIVKTIPFYKLVSFGLPNKLRGEMWETCCGSIYLRLHNEDEYNTILVNHVGEHSLALEEIEKDLNRSLPEYPAYQSEEGINRLRRVLSAYSWKDPDIGYCQAMNIVAAALLIYMSEEQVFWCLYVLCHKIIPGYYSKTMYGVLLDHKVFEELVKKTLPMLHEHFQALDIPLQIVSLPWFLSFFLNTMPLIYSLRVVDMLFLHGPRVLFQVSLAILRVNGEALLNCEDDGECINVFKNYFNSLDEQEPSIMQEGKMKTKFDNLWDVAFREFQVIDDKTINQLREKNKGEIFQGIENFAKRTEIRNIPKTPHINSTQLCNLYDRYYSVISTDKYGNQKAPIQNSASMSYHNFKTFMAQLVDWVNIKDENNQDNNNNTFAASMANSQGDVFSEKFQSSFRDDEKYYQTGEILLRRLYDNWSVEGVMTLETLCLGLNKLLDKDIMNLLSDFFNLYDPEHRGKIGRETILQIAEDLLYITRPWREGYLFDDITNRAIEVEIAKKIVKRRQELQEQGMDLSRDEEIKLPSDVKFNDQKWKNKQSERYLSSSSNFLKLIFQYAQPEEDPDDPLINLDDDDNEKQEHEKKLSHNKALDPSHPMYITPSMFRMVILADETYESFFSQVLSKSIHIDDQINVSFGMINNIRGMFNNFLADGRRVAVEVRKRMDDAAASASASISAVNNNVNSTSNNSGNHSPTSTTSAGATHARTSRATTVSSYGEEDDDFGNFVSPANENDELLGVDVNLSGIPDENGDMKVLHDNNEDQLSRGIKGVSLI